MDSLNRKLFPNFFFFFFFYDINASSMNGNAVQGKKLFKGGINMGKDGFVQRLDSFRSVLRSAICNSVSVVKKKKFVFVC